MELSATQIAVVLVACVAAIGVVFTLYQRGVFGGAKVADQTATPAAKP